MPKRSLFLEFEQDFWLKAVYYRRDPGHNMGEAQLLLLTALTKYLVIVT
jgi:hypothetical protein